VGRALERSVTMTAASDAVSFFGRAAASIFDRPGVGMPIRIAWRNLVNDRGRFGVTLVGIMFSVVLMGVQLGLLLGVISTTSTIVAHSGADIFIAAPGVKSVDVSAPQLERRRFQALGAPGVARAEIMSLDFRQWKRTDGVAEIVAVVGVSPNATMGLPWSIVGGESPRALLSQPDGVIVDRLYAEKLGVLRKNQLNEINGVRVRVVGFTQGIRTFTQSPFVFTSLTNERRMTGLGHDHISYVLVRVAEGWDPRDVRDRLQKRLPDAEVVTAAEFAGNSAKYWLFTTGAGASLMMSALLALLIGGVVVAQTLYASTMDRLPEYAMLRAIGSSAGYLHKIVLTQAGLAGVLGYVLGLCAVTIVVWQSRDASAAPEMPSWLAIVIGVVTLLECLVAAVVSLRAIARIDPVEVFR